MSMTPFGLRVLLLAVAGQLAACSGPPPAPVAAPPLADTGVVIVGDHQLRYGTVAAADLPPEVARTYGVDRRAKILLLNVSVLRRSADSLPQPMAAEVSGSQRTLIGEPRPLTFREVAPAGSVSYIAEVDATAPGINIVSLEARPRDGGPLLAARLQREFPAR